ncbi:LOW QUALITY PROTEIN: hypothetical protein HID58_048557, partial [Brassica napus]
AEPLTKKQKKVKTQNESEAAAAGKGSSEKEGSKDLELENKATLMTIVSTLDNISRKFEQFDSRLEAYELDQNRPLMDQKTIDDRVKALLEERLQVLGVGKIPENNDNPSPPSADKSLSLASPRVHTQHNSVNSPALAATFGKVFGPKKNLAKELDKKSGVKRTLAEEFGSVAKATYLDSQHIDFVFLLQRLLRMIRMLRFQPMDAAKGASVLLRMRMPLIRKKQSRGRRRLRLRKKRLRLRKKRQSDSTAAGVQKSGEDSVFADVTDEVVGEANEFAPESDVERFELVRSAIIKEYREK